MKWYLRYVKILKLPYILNQYQSSLYLQMLQCIFTYFLQIMQLNPYFGSFTSSILSKSFSEKKQMVEHQEEFYLRTSQTLGSHVLCILMYIVHWVSFSKVINTKCIMLKPKIRKKYISFHEVQIFWEDMSFVNKTF